MRGETDLLTGAVQFPSTRASFRDRQVLIVVRGDRHRRDIKALRAYIRDVRPLVVCVDGGADGALEEGLKPDVILGDMDSASDAALHCGAELIVHAYPDGRAPGRERLLELGLEHSLVPAAGTSEDVAMLMAYEKGADLIVSVGAHFNLIEFLDRKRGGMSSTFLTRLRIGEKLVDAKGVSRLYTPASTFGPLVLFLAVFTVLLVIVIATSPALSDLADLLWLKIRIWLGRSSGGREDHLAFPLMGYSARYHAVSLVAVFIALAIGILVGAEFGGDTLSNTRRNLEQSLIGNLQDARDRSDQLGGELGRSNEFADRVYPVLVRDQLDGRRIGLVAIGDLPGNVTDAVEEALGPTGGRLVGVGVVREPVDVRGLAGDLSKTRFADIAATPKRRAPSASASAARSSAAAPCSTRSAATSSRAPAATSAPSTG